MSIPYSYPTPSKAGLPIPVQTWPDLHVCSPFSLPRPLTNDFGIDGDGSSSPSSSYSGTYGDSEALRTSLHRMHLYCAKARSAFLPTNTTTTRRRRNEYATDRPANTYNDNCYTGPMCIVHIPSSSSLCTARHIAVFFFPSADKPMLQCYVHVPRVQ